MRQLLCLFLFICTLGPGLAQGANGDASVDTRSDGTSLEFRWRNPVTYAATSASNLLVVRFSRPVSPHTSKVVRRLKGLIVDVSVTSSRRVVIFRLQPGVTVSDRTSGDKRGIVLSFYRSPDRAEKNPPKKTANRPETFLLELIRGPSLTRLGFRWSQIVSFRVQQTDRTATITFGRVGKIDSSGIAANLKAAGISLISSVNKGRLRVKLAFGTSVKLRATSRGATVNLDIEKISTPLSGLPEPPYIDFLRAGGSRELVIGLKQEAPIAVFRFAGRLWIVIASDEKLRPAALQKKLGKDIPGVEMSVDQGATVLKLRVAKGLMARVAGGGNLWRIKFQKEKPTVMPRALQLIRQHSAKKGGAISIDVGEGGPVISLKESVVGTTLHIIPVASAAAISRQFTFVRFRTVSALLGVVLESFSDSLQVTMVGSQVTIRDTKGMALSRPMPR